MDAATAFRPLAPGEATRGEAEVGGRDGALEPLVPPDGSEPLARHPGLGRDVQRWPYHGPDGVLQGYVCRFDTPRGKEFRPLRYGAWEGQEGWHWKGWADDDRRPLYGLQRLPADPEAPVLVTEGEKKVDAAAAIFPDLVAVAPMNGAESPHMTDWSPLRGRDVTIWPDQDGPGRRFAAAVADLLHAAGAASVRVVAVPAEWPAGWDLADPPPEGVGVADLRGMVEAASEHRRPFREQAQFRLAHERHRDPKRDQTLEPGLHRLVEAKGEDGEAEERWARVGSVLEVAADSRTTGSDGWGRLLRVVDRDGVEHRWAMPMELLAGDGADVRRELLRLGFEPATGSKPRVWLQEYLTTWRPAGKVRCVDQVGWHGEVFVLPDRTVGRASEPVVLQAAIPPKVSRDGSLQGWRSQVAALAVGNSHLTFALALPFAGPLLRLAGEESGGFAEVGGSSIGKSTLLAAAASVTGGEVGSWRATDNGLEAVAAGASDLALLLDELGQAPAGVLEAASYMLGNGRGKERMTKGIASRPPLTWKTVLYASGEVGLAAKLGEAGKRPRAGQEVRLVDLRADAGGGLGVFEELHGQASGDALSRHLRRAAQEQRGTALVAFLEAVTADAEQARALLLEHRERFVGRVCPAGADGQVTRVAGRFGLVAAAGELASRHGVTGWPPGTALDAVDRRFRAWLEDRGGPGAAEDREALAAVRLFLEQHGAARFEPAWANEQEVAAAARQNREPREMRVPNRAGFRRLNEDGRWTYHVLPEVWRAEVCKGMDPGRVAKLLAGLGHLQRGEGKNLGFKERIPGVGSTRVYMVLPSILEAGE